MENSTDILERMIKYSRKHGAEAADGVFFETTSISISQRLGKPEDIERAENSAFGLRVFVRRENGETGQANVSTTDFSKEAVEELVQTAIKMARLAPADSSSALAESELYPKEILDLDLLDNEEPDTGWFKEQCLIAEDTARSVKGITNSEGADASYNRSYIQLITSNGFSGGYGSSYFSVSASVIAGEGTAMERDYDFTSARHREYLKSPEIIGKEAAKRAIARLNPRKVKSCVVPVIFDPRVSKSLISIFTGSISGNAIARGASFLKDSMAKKIFSETVNIIDDPHILRGFSSRPFDMEGVENKKMSLVENGVLKTWLLDIRTANKLKLKTTGHAARGISSLPYPSSSNVYMEAGTITPKELMTDIKSGLYLTQTFGMGVNTITGDYSQGAEGFWIENGEIVYPVSEITVAGNLHEMFMNLTAANDLTFRYSSNAPTVRIENMTVAGV